MVDFSYGGPRGDVYMCQAGLSTKSDVQPNRSNYIDQGTLQSSLQASLLCSITPSYRPNSSQDSLNDSSRLIYKSMLNNYYHYFASFVAWMNYCGSTPQSNSWCDSWARFFAEHRIHPIGGITEENHGTDVELTTLVERLLVCVIPKLLGSGHLGGKQVIEPVLIHGDLWEGSRSKGRFSGREGLKYVTFDLAFCYVHSEFELGLMRMVGGFSAGCFNEYHHLLSETNPKNEYDDIMKLCEL